MIKFWAGATACLVGLCAGYGLASRNSSGTMAAINGPYTPGSVISSSVINARFSDIETEITDSASRSGKGGFTSPVRGADGVVTAPTFAFTSETGTGLYRIGSSDLGLSINQTKTGEWTANGYRSADGAVATPSLSFFNDTGSGLYRVSSNDLGFAINGVRLTEWNTNGFAVGAAPISKYPFDVQKISGANHARFGSYLTLMGSAPQLGFNLYNDGSNKYMTTGIAGYLSFDLTNYFIFYTAPSGSADAAATITERFRVNTSGVTVTGTLTMSGGGSVITAFARGGCTLNGASPSTCTLAVVAGQTCAASFAGTTAPPASGLRTNNSAGTVTVTGANGLTDGVNIVCF